MDNSVFISYRRNVSAYVARAVFQDLRANNINAFMDIESIDMGQFDTIILNQIAARPYFLLILTPGTLDRCVESGDWLLREIEHAMKLKRNIIPIVTNNFNFDDAKKFLSDPMKTELPRWNAVNVPYDYFEEGMNRLRTRFLKPIDLPLTLTPKADQVAVDRKLEQIRAEPTVTEEQLSAQDYFDRGLACYNKGDFDGAIAAYSEALHLNPEYPDAYNNRGNIRFFKKDIAGAIADYSEAIHFNPQYWQAYINRGYVYESEKEHGIAATDYDKALELNPNHPSVERLRKYITTFKK